MPVSIVDYLLNLPEALHFAKVQELSEDGTTYYRMLSDYGNGSCQLIRFEDDLLIILIAHYTPKETFVSSEPPNLPELNFVFQQIRDCQAEGQTLRLYLESKVMELLSLVIRGMEKEEKHISVKLDYKDIRSLKKTVTFMKKDLSAYPSGGNHAIRIPERNASWTVHAMTLSALFLLLEILKIRKLIPAVILLLEGLTFLSGFQFRKSARFMFGVWGMYVQSNLYEGMYGFSIISVMITQVTIIIVCYQLGSYLLKGKEMEGV